MQHSSPLPVPAAYLGVVLIWTTTPLTIKWSSEGVHFLFGLLGRMLIGSVICLLLLAVLRTPLPYRRRALLTYLVNGAGIWGGMSCVYWGARFIPSGWIAVIFGLTPVVTGALATLVLRERGLTPPRLTGMGLALTGMALIFLRGTRLGAEATWGIGAVLIAVLIHSVAAVALKKFGNDTAALPATGGGLIVATVLLTATWLLIGGEWPAQIPPRAFWSIVYLGICGSTAGFMLYFYVLQRLEATKVALITLITPVSALVLGYFLNGETLTAAIAWGTAAILSGLLLVQFGDRWRNSAARKFSD